MRRRTSPDLTVIKAPDMRKTIEEFNALERAKFLKRYDSSRSSKFYLMFGDRLYDTKALVSAAYKHATGKALRHTEFGGGDQTRAVFLRLAQQDRDFTGPFEDELGELRNLSTEYDRIPRAWIDPRELGFSKWIPLKKSAELKTGRLHRRV